ncbi:MAG: hypothetical protein R3B55_01580 [Candidatus Paceibacterota bacterium]
MFRWAEDYDSFHSTPCRLPGQLDKADPYLNVDAGTMNPTEHGEVFAEDSGLEMIKTWGTTKRFS